MTLYRYIDGKVEEVAREELVVTTQLICDTMAPTWHPVTNRIHTSPSEFRKDTIRAGCREVGDQVSAKPKPRFLDDTPGRKEELSRVYDEWKPHDRRD